MKRFIIILTFLTNLLYSQIPKDTSVIDITQINENLLNKLIEHKINKIRKEYNLDTLDLNNVLREGSKRNCINLYNIDEPAVGHTETGIFYEIAEIQSINKRTKVSYNNIANDLISNWMNSPGHKSIILEKKVKTFGAGFVCDKKKVKVKQKYNNNGVLSEFYIEEYRYYIWTSVRFN